MGKKSTYPRFAPLLLIALTLVLSGCVYLRLLDLKKQFARFDENFVLLPGDDFELRFLKPVLTASDVRWLGAEPKTVRPWKDGEEWSIRWVKTPPPGLREESVYDMEFIARLADDRLVEAAIPKRYFAYFPKELFINLLRSTGAAKVDKTDRQAETQTETPPETPLPNLKSIGGMLGAPTQKTTNKSGQLVYLYLYRLDLPKPDSKPVEMTFLFDPASGDLRKLTAKLPHGTLKYDFSKSPSKK
ncbi:MAG: hypothetical protein QM715_01405 [Nibricoccus sp.]